MNTHGRRSPSPLVLLAALAAAAIPGRLAAEAPPRPDLWFYHATNLWVDKNVDALDALMRRAAQAGYAKVLLADSKFGKLGDMDARYFRNVDRVKALAAELKIEVVPSVFPIGYSDSLLWHDPNLAEALPVRDALFVVKGGEARIAADPPVALKDGGFANRKAWGFVDENVVLENGEARTVDPKGRNARLSQKVKVRPFRQYHIAVRVKTQDFQGEPKIAVLAGNREHNHANLGVKPTQDWTEHHAVFNSLEAEEVGIYFGCWGGKTGTLAWKDARIEEVGLLNLVRRGGAPLAVKTEDGKALAEGTDFEPIADPRMGAHPWKGAYDVWHEPPAIRTILPDGTRLRVSYHHAITVLDNQVMICPSEPKTVDLLRDQAKRVHAAWGAKGYFMSHDEIRVLGWDEACQRRKLETGAILADNVKTCAAILRETNPGGAIYVWSDMFDPNHNAHKDYYLVKGDLAGSWEGLDKDVIVAAWYFEKRAESMKWFAGRGHRLLMAAYYDDTPEQVRGWLDAAKATGGAAGVMYTTWQNRYGDLEKFAEIVKSYR
jgi:hypothetical protein